MLANEIMILNPQAERILSGRQFAAVGGLLGSWSLYQRNITQLPECFGDLVCMGDLNLAGNQLESLPLSFGNVEVGGNLFLDDNRLRSLPPGFKHITVGGRLDMRNNPRLGKIDASEFPNVTSGPNLYAHSYKSKLLY